MIQQTSLVAYNQITPSLNNRQLSVLDLMLKEKTPLTNAEIALKLSWPINCVTPRVLELRKKGLVSKYKVRLCNITNNKANSWRVSV